MLSVLAFSGFNNNVNVNNTCVMLPLLLLWSTVCFMLPKQTTWSSESSDWFILLLFVLTS